MSKYFILSYVHCIYEFQVSNKEAIEVNFSFIIQVLSRSKM